MFDKERNGSELIPQNDLEEYSSFKITSTETIRDYLQLICPTTQSVTEPKYCILLQKNRYDSSVIQ